MPGERLSAIETTNGMVPRAVQQHPSSAATSEPTAGTQIFVIEGGRAEVIDELGTWCYTDATVTVHR